MTGPARQQEVVEVREAIARILWDDVARGSAARPWESLDAEGQERWRRRADRILSLPQLATLSRAAYDLAMQGLQSDRYCGDFDYKEAVDAVIAIVPPPGPERDGESGEWRTKVVRWRSTLCKCNYFAIEYDDGGFVCTHCGRIGKASEHAAATRS